MLNDTTTATKTGFANAEIYEAVKDILVNVLCTDADKIHPDAFLQEDLGAESIDFLDLAFRIDQRFGVKIKLSEVARPTSQANAKRGYTVKDFVRFIEERLAAAAQV